jgi:hypothetical protein
MRRWDRLVDAYIEEYRGRGICEATVAHTATRLMRWGSWMKARRPRRAIEAIDGGLLTRYLTHSAHFRAKTTVYGTLSDDVLFRGLPGAREVLMRCITRHTAGDSGQARAVDYDARAAGAADALLRGVGIHNETGLRKMIFCCTALHPFIHWPAY